MDSASRKSKLGRPSDTGAARTRQFSFPVSEGERNRVVAASKRAGMTLTGYIRELVLQGTEEDFQLGNVSAKSLRKSAKGITHTEKSGITHTEKSAEVVENPQGNQPPLESPRTRASGHAGTRSEKEERELRDLSGDSSSLRSSQALPPVPDGQADPEPEVDDAPWTPPVALKQIIKLSSGEVVTNTWLFANGCRIPGPDVIRLLNTPSFKPLKKSMLHCFARSLRDTYKLRWCSAYNRRGNAWRDTPRSNSSLLRAAEFLAIEYAGRNMTANEFIDACDEMRPKSVRFVPVDMLGGAIGARVAAWIPPEQRERTKGWDSHVDNSGTQWVTPAGETPVVVIRTAADRERFLKAHKVR